MKSKKNYKCLLIKTKDDRQFFTEEENLIQLMEFSKTFKAEISVVNVKEAEVLEFEELAPAFCDADYSINTDYEILEIKIPNKNQSAKRRKTVQMAEQVRKQILERFQAGQIVSLHETKDTFGTLSLSAICNHISKVKKQLEKNGKKITKVSAGHYKLI